MMHSGPGSFLLSRLSDAPDTMVLGSAQRKATSPPSEILLFCQRCSHAGGPATPSPRFVVPDARDRPVVYKDMVRETRELHDALVTCRTNILTRDLRP